MPDKGARRRIILGIGVLAVLVIAWPAVSAWWATALGSRAASLTGGATLAPTTASPTLPIVAGVIASMRLPGRTRALLVVGAFATALGAEAVLVLGGAATRASSSVLDLGSGLVQDVIPALWMLAAFVRARSAARGRGRML